MRDDDDRPERKDNTTNVVLIVIGVVVGVLLLVALTCGAIAFLVINTASKAVGPAMQAMQDMQQGESAAQMFLNSLQTGQVDFAYTSTTDAFQARQTRQQFQTFVDQNPLLAKHQQANMTGLNQNGATMTLHYTLTGNGAANVTLHVVKDNNGQWKVDSVTVP